ncbi:MAG: acyl-CoA dehydrogenase family protein [Hyphomicrobiaceae bacterium]
MSDLIDRRHLSFVLDEVLDAPALLALDGFAGHDREGVSAILDTAERMAREFFLPSYARLDASEPHVANGRVVLPDDIRMALDAFRDAGFPAMLAMPEDGGLGVPRTYGNAAFLWFQAANISIANYAMLSMSAAELLAHHGSPDQRQRYMQPLLEGRFHGTMALSEPHAGSSLGDITTSARPLADGRYALKGTKMWISGGEHELGETIVHLILARIEGAPKGVKGISLFTVPRMRLDAEGRPTVWNNIALAGLNHKMGQRGTVNTILNVGEGGDTIGEIVGEPGKGLAAMFTMMNEARIGVAMGAVAHASAGYRHSLAYARERLQGRHPDSKDPGTAQVPLIAHADVRRMLLQQKAAAEGGIAFALYLAKLADLKRAGGSAHVRDEAGLLLDFLTPVFKGLVLGRMSTRKLQCHSSSGQGWLYA